MAEVKARIWSSKHLHRLAQQLKGSNPDDVRTWHGWPRGGNRRKLLVTFLFYLSVRIKIRHPPTQSAKSRNEQD
eukprot:1148237-Pelagomonas_calceolata.AAC.4